MLKKLALLLIALGILAFAYGGFQLLKSESQEKATLKEAKALTKVAKDPTHFKEWDPTLNDAIGILTIPRLHRDLPIVEGTSPDQLEKGVGHFKRSALPGQKDQIVLSGHRDTVFRQFGALEIGDPLIVKMPYGTFTYTIRATEIVGRDDLSVIHSTKPKEELVLTTCYPFHYIGNAPKRFIVYADRER